MLGRLLLGGRFFTGGAVLGTFLSAVAMLLYGVVTVARIVYETARAGEFDIAGAKRIAVDFLELTDLFLLSTVLYIVALGLYQIFIDEGLPTPPWLKVESLDELKERLVGAVIVLVAVSFLGDVVTWETAEDVFYVGLGSASVIIGLGSFTFLTHRRAPAGAHHAARSDDGRTAAAGVPAPAPVGGTDRV